MNKLNKLTSVLLPYFNMYEQFNETLNIVNNKPVKFNPDKINRNHKVIPKNHKKFIIEGVEIYALSEKELKKNIKIYN